MPGGMNTPLEFLSMPAEMPKTFATNQTKPTMRKMPQQINKHNQLIHTFKKQEQNEKPENKEEITLSFLLNLLDGVLETPGRILIITSNYPERLDKALIRPGRIDLNIKFDNADMDMILEMFQHFYNLDETGIRKIKLELDSSIDMMLTPAEVIAVLCNHYKSPLDAVAYLDNLAVARKTEHPLE